MLKEDKGIKVFRGHKEFRVLKEDKDLKVFRVLKVLKEQVV